MKIIAAFCVLFLFTLFGMPGSGSSAQLAEQRISSTLELKQDSPPQTEIGVDSQESHEHEAHHGKPAPGWLVIPFVLLLLMIATGPLFYEHFWHHNYPKIAVALAILVVGYYLLILQNTHHPFHALAEYVQFIALLASLYIASGGILIDVDKASTPLVNVGILVIGALISNLIGTTGASMLLIRPFIRVNRNNIQPYHIIFFIFMVSNIGGSLTPIGDPPLFLGFLKGVPFIWTLEHNWPAWVLALSLLSVLFFVVDKKLGHANDEKELPTPETYSNKVSLKGRKNFVWLIIIILSVFFDPNKIDWVPAIHLDGQRFSYIREINMFSVCYFSYKFADKHALAGNEFNFEPIREVAFIFIGIFGTMMPALELVGTFAQSEEGSALINHNTLYWGTGILSGFLDNAPTYLNFLAAAMASVGADINNMEQVKNFANDFYDDSAFELLAISIASVFFGAMTYIGNGPNFMVKSIAEQSGIRMPSFFGYIIRFSIPILIPILIITWLVFFAFA